MSAPALPRAAALTALLGVVLVLTIAGTAEGASAPSCDQVACSRVGPVSSPTPAAPTPHTADRAPSAVPPATAAGDAAP